MKSTQKPTESLARLSKDPRHWQIAILGSLICWGALRLGLPITPLRAATTLLTALAIQALCTAWLGLPRFDARSPLITGLSLTLLLRTGDPFVAAAAAFAAIAGKFVLRVRGKHVFNPANLGLVVAMLLFDDAWIAPGQWGSLAWGALFLVGAGQWVIHRAERSDITWALLAAWSTLLFGRAAWLGDPWAIPVHQLGNGAFLIFAFFMISDPKTTPDRRTTRILHACLVAGVAGWIEFGLFRSGGLVWALVLCSPLVPLMDRLWPATAHRWPDTPTFDRHPPPRGAFPMRYPTQPRSANLFALPITLGSLLLASLLLAAPARAFCGFYVAKADTGLFNRASKVVIVRDGDRTVLTMANDFRGDPTEFAMVVPVPTFLERNQVHVGERAVIDHLDAYTAPRLVEYFDDDPCRARIYEERMLMDGVAESGAAAPAGARRAKQLGVTIEASYSVGEYEILILSAEESRGLETWLKENGYRLPEGASEVLGSYLAQGMRFFVAKVNLERQAELGYKELRPLQMAFETPKFMLPLRLGTLNADGPQELFVWTLTRTGRVETSNYRTVRLPTNVEIPGYVDQDFGRFYRALFDHQVEKERMRTVFLEYAWDMNWCDPCAADPLSPKELRDLGVFWIDDPGDRPDPRRRPSIAPTQARDVFVTRLHLRYTADTFPDDLRFQSTGNRENFQGRFVVHRPWSGSANACSAARDYFRQLDQRRQTWASNLSNLTGWPIAEVRSKMEWSGDEPPEPEDDRPWWQKIWGSEGGR